MKSDSGIGKLIGFRIGYAVFSLYVLFQLFIRCHTIQDGVVVQNGLMLMLWLLAALVFGAGFLLFDGLLQRHLTPSHWNAKLETQITYLKNTVGDLEKKKV